MSTPLRAGRPRIQFLGQRHLQDVVIANSMAFTDPDHLAFKYKFTSLEYGFEMMEESGETAFYGFYSSGQHGRWEAKLLRLGVDGDNKTLGEASISWEDSLAAWFNNLMNNYHDQCFESRKRSKEMLSKYKEKSDPSTYLTLFELMNKFHPDHRIVIDFGGKLVPCTAHEVQEFDENSSAEADVDFLVLTPKL